MRLDTAWQDALHRGYPKNFPAPSAFEAQVELEPYIPVKRDWLWLADHGRITVAAVINATALHFQVKPQAILSRWRSPKVVIPRQVVFYLSRELTGQSFPQIGRRVGRRDHTTVIHGYGRIVKKLAANDEVVVDAVEAIRARLQEGVAG